MSTSGLSTTVHACADVQAVPLFSTIVMPALSRVTAAPPPPPPPQAASASMARPSRKVPRIARLSVVSDLTDLTDLTDLHRPQPQHFHHIAYRVKRPRDQHRRRPVLHPGQGLGKIGNQLP